MTAYTFYRVDETEKVQFIGLLPERRKNPERITLESIMKYGRTIIGDEVDINRVFFIRVTLDESTGEIFWTGPAVGIKETL